MFTVASLLWLFWCSSSVCFAQNGALPSTFRWTSTGPLATPQNGSLAMKDFTCVNYNGKYIVYFTTVDSAGIWAGGMMTFTKAAQHFGRKPVFAVAFIAAFLSTVAVFKYLSETWHIFTLIPLMGFCQLALFAGFAIYLPELFPTRLRSTGTSFCYNVGRFIAASGPFTQGKLTVVLAGGAVTPDAKLEAVTELERTVSRLEIPARISILAGEAIHQTRSALAAEVKHVVHHAALVSRDHGA